MHAGRLYDADAGGDAGPGTMAPSRHSLTTMQNLCTNCANRARCVSLGWLSPSGFWFPDQVVIRPEPGCQLHDIGAVQVMRQLGIAMDRPEDAPPAAAADLPKAAE